MKVRFGNLKVRKYESTSWVEQLLRARKYPGQRVEVSGDTRYNSLLRVTKTLPRDSLEKTSRHVGLQSAGGWGMRGARTNRRMERS